MLVTGHARLWAAFALVSCAPDLSAQSLHLYAGGAKFTDKPALEVPAQIQSMAFGPDGRLYIADFNERLLRYDPVTGTVTSLPDDPELPNLRVQSPAGIALRPNGDLFFGSGDQLYFLDPWSQYSSQPHLSGHRGSAERHRDGRRRSQRESREWLLHLQLADGSVVGRHLPPRTGPPRRQFDPRSGVPPSVDSPRPITGEIR